MDDVDAAQQREQAEREEAITTVRLQAMRDRRGAGRPDCLDCGEDIPRPRRDAVPGATRCAGCQTIADRSAALQR